MTVLITVLLYFSILLLLSRIVAKRGSNDAFFTGHRQSPWFLVAVGMVGASISGVTFIGVPGWAMTTDMTYLQMCFGFIVGYAIIAFVLLPLYYRLRVTSIYMYLHRRFGLTTYHTGASFFILSKLLGAAAKFFVVCRILQLCLSPALPLPYPVVVISTSLMIWLYTRRGGIKALVWTDFFQTLCLLTALLLLLFKTIDMLDLSWIDAVRLVAEDSRSRVFVFDDPVSKQYFWKQFLSGIFVVIVMTGLDQDMMQKNLTCKTLRDAQKDMCSYGVLFVPVNLLFLSLGILLSCLYLRLGRDLPASGDALLSTIVLDGTMGTACIILFTIGVIASAFSSADSAVTALTTSFCVDILHREHDEKMRKMVHLTMFALFVLVTLAFDAIGSGSVMNLIYTLVSYTYGPLLGLFALGMFTQVRPRESLVPWVAIASPVVCYAVDYIVLQTTGYKFGYEMLMFNGLLTFLGLMAVARKNAR